MKKMDLHQARPATLVNCAAVKAKSHAQKNWRLSDMMIYVVAVMSHKFLFHKENKKRKQDTSNSNLLILQAGLDRI